MKISWKTIHDGDCLVSHVAYYKNRAYAEVNHHEDLRIAETGGVWLHYIFPRPYNPDSTIRPSAGDHFEGSVAMAKRKVAAEIRAYFKEVCADSSIAKISKTLEHVK